jgi:hypothetical protein
MDFYLYFSRKTKFFIMFIGLFLAAGCSTTTVGTYANDSPKFDPFKYFEGQTKAWGIVQDHRGRVMRRFSVEILGSSSDDTLILDEVFDYADGATDNRRWEIVRNSDGTLTGTAGDILGPASGTLSGNAMRWQYEMDLPVGDKTYRVKFDDWLWMLDKDILVNRSYIKKFGIKVAEVTLFFEKGSD